MDPIKYKRRGEMFMIRNPKKMAADMLANDSYVFLIKELEKLDPKIYEPLTGTSWPRDMPVITGGGIVESITAIDVTYATAGTAEDNITRENLTSDSHCLHVHATQTLTRSK